MDFSSITVNLGTIAIALVFLWGIFRWLLEKNFIQFSSNLDIKFEGFTQQLFNVQSRLSNLEGVTLDIKRLELEIVKRDGQNVQTFVLRDEFKEYQAEQRLVSEKMFDYFEKITDKLDNKVSKVDCKQHGNRRSTDDTKDQ